MMPFLGYHPPNYYQPDPPAEPTLATFKAAQDVHASHLSADGSKAYCTRYGKVLKADWLGRSFGAWQEDEGLTEMPAGAVKLE